MNINIRFRTGKILTRILLAILLVILAQPAAPALAGRQNVLVGGALPADLLRSDSALDLTTGFRAALDLRGWKMTLDAHRGPLLRPLGNPAFIRTAAAGTWSALGTGMGGTNPTVYAIAISGTSVYAGGDFTSVGTCTSNCNNIAMWNGSTWSALGTGMNGIVRAIVVSGSSVYAGGDFTSAGTCTSDCNSIAKWDGSTWSAMGTGMGGTSPTVRAMAVSGTSLYAGGYFASAGTCTTGCNNIARWNGSTWSALSTGMGGPYPYVYDLAISGTDLYAGGDFTSAGTCTDGCTHIARWNGSTWSALDTGVNDTVYAVAISGSNVYAGGAFTGTVACPYCFLNVAKWDGSSWSAMGTGLQNGVYGIVVNGSELYVGGWFSTAGTCTSGCTNIAKWDGLTWSALGTGTNDTVQAIAVSASVLYAGGNFTSAGTCTSGCNKIARYDLASNANLSSLLLSSGAFTPAFSPNVITYTADVGNGVTDITVTPTAADLGATIQVRINTGAWSAVPSGSPSGALSLNVGDNPINVLVIAENGLVTKTYTVTVTRAQPSMLYLPMVLR